MNKNPTSSKIKNITKILLIILAVVSMTSFSIVRWTEHQFLNTNNWVAAVGPLPKDPVVSSAIGLYVTNQLFDNVDVKQKIEQALPPKAAFLASPLSDQLRILVQKVSTKVVSSDAFQAVWISANKQALNSQLQVARGEKKPPIQQANEKISLNIDAIKKQISLKLGNVAETLPSLAPSNANTLSIQADLQATPRIVQRTVKQIDFIHAVLPFFAAATFLGALALSNNRLKTTFRVSIVMLAIYLMKIIGAKAAKDQLVGQISNPAYIPAVSHVYDVLTASLFNILYVGLATFAAIAILSFFAGPSEVAEKLRRALKIDKIKSSALYAKSQTFKPIVRKYLLQMSVGLAFLGLLYLAFGASLSLAVIAKTALAVCSLATLLYIYAAPQQNQ